MLIGVCQRNLGTTKMSDPSAYTYEDPLKGYENAPQLPDDLNEDGKSFKNPPRDGVSKSYDEFTSGVTNSKRGGTPWLRLFHNPD